ncbi:MAG: VWA domain-containing protein [Gammaproteobacteria bacterium]
MPESFHFQQPEWLLALLPLMLLLWLLRQSGESSSAWRKVCDARLLPYLLDTQGNSRSRLPLWLLALGGLLAVIALADPVWEQQQQPVYRNEASRVVVLDLSNSMLSPDLEPSRLVRARYKVSDILKQSMDGQTGLVVFAGDAFTVAPLTHDTDTIEALLSPLQPALMPVQGSRVDLGLLQAANLMQQAGIQRGDILLLTDGFDGQRAIDTAARVYKDGYRVSVLGVGTDTGAPVPTGRGGYLRDQQGDIVLPALDQAALRQLATAGGGAYTAISSGDHDVRFLLSKMTTQAAERTEQAGMHTDKWQSNGPWLAVLLLPLAALAFRRGWLLVLLILLGGTVSAPQPAMALGWNDLWLRPDQQAARALQAGEPEQAAQLARDPALRGTAEYQAGNYEAAQQAFATQADADADYNQGNALAQLQRYEEALAAYEQALEKQPQMADALHNKAEIERLLQQQREQEQEQQQSESGDNADNQQGQQDQAAGDSQQDGQNDTGEQGSDGSQAEQQNDAGEQGDEERNDAPQDVDSAAGEQQEAESEDPTEEAQQSADAQDADDAEADSSSAQQSGEEAEQAAEQQAAASAEPLDSEEQRAAEQWLRRIPDDPGGLLQRKFLYQYKQRAGRAPADDQQTW